TNRGQESSQTWPAIFEVSGQFRFRAEENRKNDFSSQRGFSSLRARAGLFFHPNEYVDFLIQPQAVHVFGEPALLPATSNLNVAVGTSGANRDPQLSFHQAYGELRANQLWRLILGRQIIALGDEVLVGASDWENPGRSFDGVRSRLEWGQSSWDLFSAKLWDNNTQTSGRGDRDFHGTYLSWNHPNRNVSLSPYLFWLRDHRSSLNQVFTSGLHFRVNLDELELKTEASGQWGDSSGQQIWAELKSKQFSSIRMQVGVDGFWASPEFNPLFPTTHKWLGWADVLGRRNLSGLGFQASVNFLPQSEFLLRGLHFLKSSSDFAAYQVDGTTPVNNSSDSSLNLGSELDFVLKSSILPSVELISSAAIFLPADSLKTTLREDWMGRFEVSLVSNF
ncbi:MAG: alginate export family protein, partial [Pseudomonadota bacterium]